jgi:hypothetical protein
LKLDYKRFSGRSFRYSEGNECNGIIHHLTEKCGGNVHEKGVVNITASGTERNVCHNVVKHGWNDFWYSNNTPNSWISFDFKDKSVFLQHYTLKSAGFGHHYFTQWEIEGSNDGNTWESLDSRNTRDLCGNYVVKTYECSKSKPEEFFRFIRMRQTDKSSNNCDYFMLSEIEFFGTLKI